MTTLIAAGKRVPGVYVAVDTTRAVRGPATKTFRAVLIGGKTSAGTLAQKTKALATSADQVRGMAGAGSMLHNMAKAWFAQTQRPLSLEVLALDDAGGGAAATATLAVSVSSPQAGTIPLMIAGYSVRVGVATGDSANTIAAAIRTAVNLVDGIPVVASGSAANVILTAVQKGSEGNSIDLRVAYFADEAMPTGVTVSGPAQLSGGATNPSLDAPTFAALGDVQYDVIACGFADAGNLGLLHTELASRFGPDRQLQGSAFVAKRDTLANLITFGTGKNSPHVSCVGLPPLPTPPWEVAAACTAVAGGSGEADPAAPVQRVVLVGVLPPREVDGFTAAERELLLHGGIATVTAGPGGVVQTERLVTLYQLSPAGAPDVSLLDVETLFTCSFIRWDWRRRTELLHPAAKLANDGTRFDGTTDVVTPLSRRAEFAAAYREWEAQGIVENFEDAMRDSTFLRDPTDRNRMNETICPDFVNQFRVLAVGLQFRL